MDDETQRVIDAWTNPGPMPSCHRAAQARLRSEWPVLARALDALAKKA